MKLLNPQGCQFSCGRGNDKELTMIVEVHGMGFWTRVRFPPGPLAAVMLPRTFDTVQTNGNIAQLGERSPD